jgi:hypothetical protein
MISGIPNS